MKYAASLRSHTKMLLPLLRCARDVGLRHYSRFLLSFPSRSTIGVHAVLRQPMSSSKTDTPGCWPCRAPRTTLTPIPSRSTIDDYAAFPAAHCATRFRYNWPVGLVAFHDRRSCSPSCGLASNNPVTIHSMEILPNFNPNADENFNCSSTRDYKFKIALRSNPEFIFYILL